MLRRVGPSHLFSISFRQGSNYPIGVAGAGFLSSLLKREVKELRKANEILKLASAFFA
jgi:hypothetical protein